MLIGQICPHYHAQQVISTIHFHWKDPLYNPSLKLRMIGEQRFLCQTLFTRWTICPAINEISDIFKIRRTWPAGSLMLVLSGVTSAMYAVCDLQGLWINDTIKKTCSLPRQFMIATFIWEVISSSNCIISYIPVLYCVKGKDYTGVHALLPHITDCCLGSSKVTCQGEPLSTSVNMLGQ